MHNVQSADNSGVHRERGGDVAQRPLPVLPEPAAGARTRARAAALPRIAVQACTEPAAHVQVCDIKIRKTGPDKQPAAAEASPGLPEHHALLLRTPCRNIGPVCWLVLFVKRALARRHRLTTDKRKHL